MGTIIIFALAGLFFGGVGALILGSLIAVVFSISQMEGSYAMGLAFFWIPLGALLGLIVGAALGWRHR